MHSATPTTIAIALYNISHQMHSFEFYGGRIELRQTQCVSIHEPPAPDLLGLAGQW